MDTAPRTPEQAITAARTQSTQGPQFGVGLCLQRVRLCYGVGPVFADAAKAWVGAQLKHRTEVAAEIPRGVPVWWTGGRNGHGHVAIATGDGSCWSTDFERPGWFDRVRIDDITRAWALDFQGWSEDLNGVRVWSAPPPPAPDKTRGVLVDHAERDLEDALTRAHRRGQVIRAARLQRVLRVLRRQIKAR